MSTATKEALHVIFVPSYVIKNCPKMPKNFGHNQIKAVYWQFNVKRWRTAADWMRRNPRLSGSNRSSKRKLSCSSTLHQTQLQQGLCMCTTVQREKLQTLCSALHSQVEVTFSLFFQFLWHLGVNCCYIFLVSVCPLQLRWVCLKDHSPRVTRAARGLEKRSDWAH